MLSQAGGSCEAFGADVTEKRFAAGVNSLMVLKAALRAELFSTFRTAERRLPSVNPHVNCQICLATVPGQYKVKL